MFWVTLRDALLERMGESDPDAGLGKLLAPAAPERVARDAIRGTRRGRAVVYSPPIWRPILFVIRCRPDFLFRRLRL